MKSDVLKFIEEIKLIKNYSEHTVKNYLDDLNNFLEFLNRNGIKSFNDVEYQDIRNYISYLYECKYTNKTISRHISTLRSFFKYMEVEGKVQNNPACLISNPKTTSYLPKCLNYEETKKVLGAYKLTDNISIRNAFILEMLYSTGLRVSELVNLKLKDIKINEREIKVLGKGSKERIVYFGTPCLELLNEYLKKSYKNLNTKNSEYLFLSKTGKQINDREVRQVVYDAALKAGLNFKISPHTLRHTFATHMLNEGSDIRSVQELLGHENLSTTQVYTHLSNEKIREVYLKSHPRARGK